MKGLVGAIFIGICLIIAAAVAVGALTFPEAMGMVWGMIWWIVLIIVIIIVIILAIVVIAVLID